MRENPPIMVLSEETGDSVTFRFRGRRWAVATLIPGSALVVLVGRLHFSPGTSNPLLLGVVGMFGVLLLYSSVYSWTATQWLIAGGSRRSVRFHKKNVYGLVEWEKPGSDFAAIRVWKYSRAQNWSVTLVDQDGYGLHLGENAFGAFGHERACALARKVSSRTGIPLDDPLGVAASAQQAHPADGQER